MVLKQGLPGETIDNCIRLYNEDQFPVIEVYIPLDEAGNPLFDDEWLVECADKIEAALM